MQDTIVMYPAPGMGHVISMVELGKLILHHYPHKFSITILLSISSPVESPDTISYTHQITQTNPSITFHLLPSVTVDTSPTRSRAAIAFHFIRLSSPNVLHSLQDISKTSNISAFIIDFFCTSALPIAADLRIPTYYFFTSGVAALAFYLYFPQLHKQITKSFKDLIDTHVHVPGLPPLPATHAPEPLLDLHDPAYDDILYFCLHLPKSNGIIVNTFDELEPKVVKVIADGACVPDAITPPIYNVGPLIAKSSDDGSSHECLSWLDAQPCQSVVFLCFGSRGSFSVEQVREIANGLERSGQRFLWVVKITPESAVSGDVHLDVVMPEGFLERTKDRGLVVKSWAPQVAVLSHESVGGFVTHCGWNSVLEAVVAGVPMVAWPLYAEQHLNKGVMVDDMKMAIPLEQRESDRFVSAGELEKGVRELMESERGRQLRELSRKMKEMASAAQGKFGSSTAALANLVELWKQP